MTEIKITSEKDAFDLIKKALQDEIGDQFNICFEGWPSLNITLKGEGYASTITPSLMEALVEFQRGLDRTYAKIIYDQDSAVHLKKIDKKDIEFKAKISDGSSIVDISLTDFAGKIATELIGKMDPTHLVIMTLGGMLIWVAGSVFKKQMEMSSHDKDVSEEAKKSIALSQEETKRVEIMSKAFAVEPRLKAIETDASFVKLGLLRGISDADSISINEVQFDQADAAKIATTKRAGSEEKQINGNYLIRSVDTSHPEEIKIKVRHVESGKEFFARFKDHSLDQNQIDLLQDAEWSRKPIYLSVNVIESRGEVTVATIVNVSQQSPEL